MPTYEFRCPDGTIVERVFKMSEVPSSIPNPHGEGVAERIISRGGGLLFKGTGFYITDYGKDGKKDQRAASNESAGNADKGGSDKSSTIAPSASDSVPAPKAESTKSDSAKPAAPAATPAPSAPAGPSTPPKKSGDS